MKYYKVKRFMKVQIVDDKDASKVPSDWVDVTDEVRHKPSDKPNVKFANEAKKPKKNS
tara:strand:- start:47 stop:220 length:174 start_codon:yes stop_codon:yes gene_type:complete